MKSILCFVVLIMSLSLESPVWAQGRGGRGAGRPQGPPQIPPRSAPAGTSRPADIGRPEQRPPAVEPDTLARTDRRGNAAQQKMARQIGDNPVLASKLQDLLPAGTNLDEAAGGFKNLGQFVAAAHVSKNLDIPFDELKMEMMSSDVSLGDVIHALKPRLPANTAKAEAQKAEAQAKKDTASLS